MTVKTVSLSSRRSAIGRDVSKPWLISLVLLALGVSVYDFPSLRSRSRSRSSRFRRFKSSVHRSGKGSRFIASRKVFPNRSNRGGRPRR